VEDALERVGLGLVEDRSDVLGTVLLLGQAADPFVSEGVDGVVDGADGTANPRGDGGGALAVGTGQEDLGTPERERLAAAEPGLERPTLGVGQPPNEQRWFHDPLFGANHRLPRNLMQLH
jgi:hypothetical protein